MQGRRNVLKSGGAQAKKGTCHILVGCYNISINTHNKGKLCPPYCKLNWPKKIVKEK